MKSISTKKRAAQVRARAFKVRNGESYSVLPRSREAFEVMVLAAAKALYRLSPLRSAFSQRRIPWGKLSKPWQRNYTLQARACLAAVGIVEGGK